MDLFGDELVRTTQELLALGCTSHDLTRAVRSGAFIRPRNGLYVPGDADPVLVRALRIGGRCGCITAASRFGIWVVSTTVTHLCMQHSMSRMRSPKRKDRPLTAWNRGAHVLHWTALLDPGGATLASVGVLDALAQIIRCQPREFAVAAIDSALNQRLIDMAGVVHLFDLLPEVYRHLLGDVDGRAEAGSETLCRLALRDAGFHVEVQPTFPLVGRVDLLVEGRLVLEGDSFAWHGTWEQAEVDRWRDLQFATMGLMSLRPTAKQALNERALIVQAVRGLLAR